MSCNNPLYELEEQACRDTFLKNAEGANISYWFYKGLDENHSAQTLDIETHTLYLPVPDGLAGTGRKTVAAMKAALSEDWDYLIKTNVSTYLHIDNIVKAVKTWEGKDDHNIYGGTFLINDASKDIPFPRGHITIFSRSLVEGLLTYADKLAYSDKMPHTDDTLISLTLLYYIHKDLGERYQDKLKEVPTIRAWSEYALTDPFLDNVFAVRCKNEEDKERTPDNMRRLHKALKKGRKRNLVWFKSPDKYETGIGNMSYDEYATTKKMIRLLKSYKEQLKKPDNPTDS